MPSGADAFVRPSAVRTESLDLRGVDVETGRVLFELHHALGAGGKKLRPRALSEATVATLLRRLDGHAGPECR